MTDLKKLCRLAIRSEGEYVNAYFAQTNTMDGAILLASIKRSVIDIDRSLFAEWREFLQRAFGKVAQRSIGIKPVWGDPVRAPEHERSGRA